MLVPECLNKEGKRQNVGAFRSFNLKKDQSYLFTFIRSELQFRTATRDIPPFLPQQHGSVWTSMDLNGL